MAHALSPGDNLVHSHAADDGDTAAEAEEDSRLPPCLCIEHRNLPGFCKGLKKRSMPNFKGKGDHSAQSEVAE